MNKKIINKLVNTITKNGTISDLNEIAENNNIRIFDGDIGTECGLYFYAMKTKVIILNNNLNYYHRKIVLAHEIAHAILHPREEAAFTSIGYMKENLKESQANYFACKILDSIGFWEEETLCIYDHEIEKSDLGFIKIYKEYSQECETNV